jgi:hypothetical protein
MDAYIEPEGCEVFCEFCAPEGAVAYDHGGGESDCPENCAACHRPLENSLTSDGVEYVMEHIRDELRMPAEYRNASATHWTDGDYYKGCTLTAVVRDWAEQLRWYDGLSERDERVIEWYLAHSVSVPA